MGKIGNFLVRGLNYKNDEFLEEGHSFDTKTEKFSPALALMYFGHHPV